MTFLELKKCLYTSNRYIWIRFFDETIDAFKNEHKSTIKKIFSHRHETHFLKEKYKKIEVDASLPTIKITDNIGKMI